MKTPRSAKVRCVHVPTAAVGTSASAQCFQVTRVLLLALAVLGPASAQFSDFAMTGDGSTLYFASSLVLRGTSVPEQGRIYALDSTGVRLVAGLTAAPPVGPGMALSNYYWLSRPEVSRDGSVLAFTGQADCSGNDSCVFAAKLQTTNRGLAGGDRNVLGGGRLSGSGRYLFLYANRQPSYNATVLDLQTGASQGLPAFSIPSSVVPGAGRVVADDGSAVIAFGSGVYLLRGATATTLLSSAVSSASSPSGAVIDAAASTVVYCNTEYGAVQYTYEAISTTLRIYRIAAQQDQPLAAGMQATAPFLSSDGTRVMFLSPVSGVNQIWTVNTDGTALRQVTHDASGVVQAAMSDDGHVAWYLSGSSDVLQVNLDTGVPAQRLGPTMQLSNNSTLMLEPGSAVTIAGTGFSDGYFSAPSFPLPLSLGGAGVTIGGIAAPVLAVAPTAVTVQVPWEVPPSVSAQSTVLSVQTGATSSPFVSDSTVPPGDVEVAVARGAFLTDPTSGNLLAVHGDWSSMVTADNPALPGEAIHVYGVGFGRVSNPPATGMPAPATPLAQTAVQVTCWTSGVSDGSHLSVGVLFSGLAPGLADHQLDIRVPGGNIRSAFQFYCNGEGNPSSADMSFVGSFPVKL